MFKNFANQDLEGLAEAIKASACEGQGIPSEQCIRELANELETRSIKHDLDWILR